MDPKMFDAAFKGLLVLGFLAGLLVGLALYVLLETIL
jgi:hypothetical protein